MDIMKLEIEKVDRGLRNKICKAVAQTTQNVFGIKISRMKLWNFTLILLKDVKETPLDSVKDLLFAAKQDFGAIDVLYDEKLYGPSVYHLQQCVEKITKAFGLWTGFIDEKELNIRRHKKSFLERIQLILGLREREEGIGHISPKAFVLLLRKKFIKEYFKFINSKVKNNGLKKKIKNIDKELKSFEKLIDKRKKLATISKGEISDFLKMGYDYQNAFSKMDKRGLNALLVRFRIGIDNRFEKILPPDVLPEVKKRLEKIDGRIEHIFIGLNAFSLLYPLTIITYPHFTYARYPTKEMKPSDYNENLGIVSSIPQIQQALENVIKGFESLVEVS